MFGRKRGKQAEVEEQAGAPQDVPAAATEPTEVAKAPASPDAPERSASRFSRLRSRLGGGLGASLKRVLTRPKLSDADWDELEEVLLGADVGVDATEELLESLKARVRHAPDTPPVELLREALIEQIDPAMDRSLRIGSPGAGLGEPIVMVGVNGVGKTTTAGKLGRLLVGDGYSGVMGAADTFRAAAADQLETWGARVGLAVVRSDAEGADPASVAFAASERAAQDGVDVLIVDTAGRLHNKQGLMDELGKIMRVLSKRRAPAEVLLVLDATTGQNGMAQARVFAEAAGITGIVLTKLDGSAKGGIVVAVQRELGVPVKFVGLGEGADDLAPFDPADFVDGMLGE